MIDTGFYSIEYRLWLTISRLFRRYGQPYLDCILFVEDPTEFDDYRKRYRNFDEEFDNHFTTLSFARSQVGSHYPLTALEFIKLNRSMCDPVYDMHFHFAYSTIAPEDCDDHEVSILNTPAGILSYRSRLEYNFLLVLDMLDCLEMDDCPELKIRFKVVDSRPQPLSQSKEIQFGLTIYRLSMNINC